MTIHKEGYKPILISLAAVIFMAFLFRFFIPVYTAWHWLFYGSLILVFVWIVLFFRLPSRVFSIQHDKVVSPADGRVVSIEEINENEYIIYESDLDCLAIGVC